MNKELLLEIARQAITRTESDCFTEIAEYWNIYLASRGMEGAIVPADVCVMMALLKIARIGVGYNIEDSFVDIAGYAACGGEQVEIQDSM